MMNSEELQAFVTVARTKRVTAAARELGVSQPALSRRLAALEKEIGARLLLRSPTGLVLTNAGERFLSHASRALASLSAGVQELQTLTGEPRGAVSLGSGATVGAYALPDVLATFHAKHAEVVVRLREGLPDELEALVLRGELDMALLNLPVASVDLTVQKLWREDYLLAVPASHRLASSKQPIALAETAGEPLVVVPGVPSTRALEEAAAQRGVKRRVVLEADNLESVRRMVARGLGVALLPRLMTRVALRDVRYLEVGKGNLKRQVALVHNGQAYLTAAARALRDVLVGELRRR
jgi:DNA-binding transcriptional LysR family regulator